MRSLSNVYKNRFFVTDSEKVPIPDVAFEDKKTALSPRGEDDPEFPQEPSGETAEPEAPETDAPEETTAEENVPSEPAEPQLWVPEHIESAQTPAVTKETIGEFYADELRELAAEVAQQAYYDALNKKKAELRDCISGVQSLMDELVRAQQQFIEDYTRELKYMATDIAEKMIFEHIAEDDQPLGATLRETFKHAFRGGQRTMNIGGKHQLHRFHLHWLRCLYDSGSAAGYQPQRLAESAT